MMKYRTLDTDYCQSFKHTPIFKSIGKCGYGPYLSEDSKRQVDHCSLLIPYGIINEPYTACVPPPAITNILATTTNESSLYQTYNMLHSHYPNAELTAPQSCHRQSCLFYNRFGVPL